MGRAGFVSRVVERARLVTTALARPARLASDAVAVAVVLREVEEARCLEGPSTLVARLRERGKLTEPRSPAERKRLFGLVYRIDTLMNGESNCYRRSLAHVALDRQSACEPFVLGLDVAGAVAQTGVGALGHAWVVGNEGENENTRFDVEFRL